MLIKRKCQFEQMCQIVPMFLMHTLIWVEIVSLQVSLNNKHIVYETLEKALLSMVRNVPCGKQNKRSGGDNLCTYLDSAHKVKKKKIRF